MRVLYSKNNNGSYQKKKKTHKKKKENKQKTKHSTDYQYLGRLKTRQCSFMRVSYTAAIYINNWMKHSISFLKIYNTIVCLWRSAHCDRRE